MEKRQEVFDPLRERESGMTSNNSSNLHSGTWLRWLMIAVALVFLCFFLFIPLAAVFTEGLRQGWDAYRAAIIEPEALDAIKLTLLITIVTVPINLIFGVIGVADMDG